MPHSESASLNAQSASLSAQSASLSAQSASLSAQSASLSAQSASLSAQSASFSAQSASLSAQSASLSAQSASLTTEVGGDSNSAAEPPQQIALKPEHVHDLFLKYPGLKARLNAIYQSTRQHASASATSARRRHGAQGEAAAEDAALANGLTMLRRALHDDAGDQGINAFATYVTTLASS
ncbi:hypothetical protein DV737_g2656, partial [Chaetothyriales sp. CBS 132003]